MWIYVGNFVKQNINSHEKFEGTDDFMCNSYKIISLLHQLPLDCAAGEGGIFAEHIFYADSSRGGSRGATAPL